MKNEFRNDGRQSMAWLADQGASEAEYDDQGGVVLKKKQPPESEYERLKRVLYDFEVGEFRRWHDWQLAHFFDDIGFPDLAHAIREGIHDREKAAAEPYHEVCPTHPEADKESRKPIIARIDPKGTVNLTKLMKDMHEDGPDLSVNQSADDWIDHDGSGRPGWLEDNTIVDVVLDSDLEGVNVAGAYKWTKLPHARITKYRLSEGSTIPDGWRRHEGGGMPSDLGYLDVCEVVQRDGRIGRNTANQILWRHDKVVRDAQVMWYRLSKGS